MIKGKTGIVVLNYNTYKETVDCIVSIEEHVKSNYCIYLVDNHSTEECVDKLKYRFAKDSNVKIIIMKENLGYSSGNNNGIKQALNDGVQRILILNSDVVLLNDIVYLMSCELSDDIAYIGPRIYDINGKDGQRIRKNYNFGFALFNKKPFYFFRHIFRQDNYIKYNPNKRFEFSGSSSGCCFLIDASIFKEINYFDDNVFLYSEEYIIGKKLERVGKKCCYLPSAKIIHKEGTSTKKISNAFVDYHLYASEYYLLREYCELNSIQLRILKIIRILNFFIKSVLYKGYRERFKLLIRKFKEIDEGILKITF